MNAAEAEQLLSSAELTPCAEGPLPGGRQLVEACLQADIPAALEPVDKCEHKGGCGGTNVRVVVRTEDVARVAQLMRAEWLEAVRQEGVDFTAPQGPAENGELPCPACGTAAPLVDGACSDCGLQLE